MGNLILAAFLKTQTMKVQEIAELLQMHPPFLLLRSAVVSNSNGGIEISTDAEITKKECIGHRFPPEVPLVHVCRVMAQTGSLLLSCAYPDFLNEVIGVERIRSHISEPIQPPLRLVSGARLIGSGHGVHQLTIKCRNYNNSADIAEITKISYVLRRGGE